MTMQFISHANRMVVVPWSQEVQNFLPHGTRLSYGGQEMYAVHHGDDETRLLRNLGLDVKAPIAEHYDWPGPDKPFAQQVLTAASMTINPRSYVLNDMGTGKTKACLWAFDYLRRNRLARRMLVVAPLSTLRFVWQREAMLVPNMRVEVLDGERSKRISKLANKVDIYIINHDGIKVISQELLRRLDIDVICFDEVAAFRNHNADRSKIAREIAKGRRFVWGMTGQPVPNSPTDAYGIARLITPATAPRSFTHFRNETMVQLSQFNWKPKPDATTTVANTLQPSVRFTLEDTVELPQVIERFTDVDQGPQQRKAYKEMAAKMAADLLEGRLTAANGGVALSKLLQISSGYVYLDDQKVVDLDPILRLQTLVELIDGARAKVIVFASFLHTVAGIKRHFDRERLDYAIITGATTPTERDDIFRRFQGTEEFDVLLAHPQCMAHGLTLTAADTIVWVSPVTSLETFEQANARISRVGQTRKQQVFMLQGTPAERRIYQRLKQKRDVQESVLDLLKELTDE